MVVSVLQWVLVIAVGSVLAVLAIGVGSLVKGGDFNRKYSNKLMRLRVATQAFAVFIAFLLWLAARNGW